MVTVRGLLLAAALRRSRWNFHRNHADDIASIDRFVVPHPADAPVLRQQAENVGGIR